MNKVLKNLVIIWLSSISTPAAANLIFNSDNSIENMYLSKNSPKEESFKSLISSKNEEKEIKEEDRTKRLYVAAYGGYFYTRDNMEFNDANDCQGGLKPDFVCNSSIPNPIKLDYENREFYTVAFGINSENPLRLEFSYFELGKELEINGKNQVGADERKYVSSTDVLGGSINAYLDLVIHRNKPGVVFVPYVMAGIGISEVDLSPLAFTGTSGNLYEIGGNKQTKRTTVFGAGFSVGLNNYISLDIGYRYYDFGTIKTADFMTETNNTDPLNPVVTNHDIELKSDFEAHTAVVGIKFQI